MEDIFDKMSRNLDVRPRIAVFNKKLDYANELTEVIRSHLHTKHSTGLEWAIIVLITIEVGFAIYHTFWEKKEGAAVQKPVTEFVEDVLEGPVSVGKVGKGDARRREREHEGRRQEFGRDENRVEH